MDPQTYCQQKALKSGSSFYYSFLSLPKAQKQAIIALYAYCREVDDVVDETKEPTVALKKLNWWHDETLRLYQGNPQHPVTKAMSVYVKTYAWPQTLFFDLLRGMRMDLDGIHFVTQAQLDDYCYCVASTVGMLSTHIFGFENPAVMAYANRLGMCLQMINIIRDLGEDLRRGRLYIPDQHLSQFGLSRERLLAFEYSDTELKPLLQFEASLARNYYQQAMTLLPKTEFARQRPSMMMATIYLALLDTIEREEFAVLHQKIKLTPIKKLMLAWKGMRLKSTV